MRKDAPSSVPSRLRASRSTSSPSILRSFRGLARTPTPLFFVIGGTGGLFGGLLGIGGGSAIAPLLLLMGKLRPVQVSGTTLATVLVISIAGSGAYASLGNLDLRLAWPIALGSVVGSVLGALTSGRLERRLMMAIFVAILPYFAAKEFWPSFAAPEIATSTASLAALGLCAGFLSGLLGISGASLVVPSLVAFFLIDHRAAQGIAMSVALADSLAGSITHANARNIDYRALGHMAAPALLAAVAGALVSNSLPATALRVIFGAFVVTVWAMMLARLIGESVRLGAITQWLKRRMDTSYVGEWDSAGNDRRSHGREPRDRT